MAYARITLPIIKALLGLMLLACPPVIDAAGAQGPFATRFDDLLLPSELSDAGKIAEGECPNPWGDGDADPDAAILLGSSCRWMRDLAGTGLRRDLVQPVRLFDHLGARHATGPPSL